MRHLASNATTDTDMVTYLEAAAAPLKNTGQIRLYDEAGFAGMRKACQLTARCLDELAAIVAPGVSTDAIDRFVFEYGMDNGAIPATLNYRGYTKSSCTSINHVVCHGIPDGKPLRDGDIVNIDVTFILDGWHGDSSRMYPVGRIKRAAERLLEVTHDCMMRGIAAIRDFCGHGVGLLFHDAPNILHYGSPGEGVEMRPGMIFTVEPMINLGRPHVKVLSDGWTAVTRDRSLSAQYEHSIGVTETGCEIFTLSPAGLDRPGLPA
jgi:methionyl aminopeptidase